MNKTKVIVIGEYTIRPAYYSGHASVWRGGCVIADYGRDSETDGPGWCGDKSTLPSAVIEVTEREWAKVNA